MSETRTEVSSQGSDVGKESSAAPTLKEKIKDWPWQRRYNEFLRMLHGRGSSICELSLLATKSAKNWPHVGQVLRGVRKGEKTWPHLIDFLERDELILLGKDDLIIVHGTTKCST